MIAHKIVPYAMPAIAINLLPTSGVLGMLTLLGACVWILMDPTDRLRPRVFFFVAAIPLYGFICSRVLAAENAWLPLKFDFVLARMDQALGLSAATVARALRVGFTVPFLCDVYRSLPIAMALAYGLNLKSSRGPSILWAFVAEMLIGPCLYAALPACGPIYAFPSFPWSDFQPGLAAARLNAEPNAMPSLHMATAVLLVIFASGRRWRVLFALYAAAIALGTLVTGEHYLMDLVAGVPFACFAAAAAWRRAGLAAWYLGIVAAWMVVIRIAPEVLVLHPGLLRLLAALTIVTGIHGVARFWQGLGSAANIQPEPQREVARFAQSIAAGSTEVR